ncbi:Lipopolysaccharide core biosynthesis protein RfaG [Candidatus Profftia lariciata]|uniref:glycosyltransferase family 4 protein n=1 Tax=Candidatus Profftia lariciata TaxID=1987921 RepID=UPI001D018C88|nr:glycosyltransferase family 4 protein [Candidatus Profftia lariciata]UDG81349.1 Lipopolysaccharide core biosynthesis protein RfaG [Candidatus Profftia lariciata]
MIIALCIYKYFPFGGLQRDFMRIAQTVADHGHYIRIYTYYWHGICPINFELIQVPVKAYTNHSRNNQYFLWVQSHLKQYPVDRIIGFNKMPNLDIYYAGDICYAEKIENKKNFLYKLTKRYKHYLSFEKATFAMGTKTKLLMLTNKQIVDFKKHYSTESERFFILPPSISLDRKYSQHSPNARNIYRKKNGINENDYLVLQVGSDFTRKGVDRTIIAFAALPNNIRCKSVLFIVGQDNNKHYKKLVRKLSGKLNIYLFLGRYDVSELMIAADILLHPAYQEAAGIVLIEAIALGLPVITTSICGYAHYINKACCGIVIQEPYKQHILNDELYKSLINCHLRKIWASNAKYFANIQNFFSVPKKIIDIIESNIH